MGPTAWITYFAGSAYPLVMTASPVLQPPSLRHSANSWGPAARWMAPSTPPPPRRETLAALTIASTRRVVISSRTALIVAYDSTARARIGEVHPGAMEKGRG